jgi:hypothetical protein
MTNAAQNIITQAAGIDEDGYSITNHPASPGRLLILPSGNVSISESAHEIFSAIAPSRTLFYRGGTLAEVIIENGTKRLGIVKDNAFRSRVEKFGRLMAWRIVEKEPVLKPSKMPREDAAAIMQTTEARDILPPVACV